MLECAVPFCAAWCPTPTSYNTAGGGGGGGGGWHKALVINGGGGGRWPPGGQLPSLLWFSTPVHLLRALQGRQPRAVVAGAPHHALCRAPSLSVGGA